MKDFLPIQPKDIPATYTNVSGLESAVDFKPSTNIQIDMDKLVKWYFTYYKETEAC